MHPAIDQLVYLATMPPKGRVLYRDDTGRPEGSVDTPGPSPEAVTDAIRAFNAAFRSLDEWEQTFGYELCVQAKEHAGIVTTPAERDAAKRAREWLVANDGRAWPVEAA